MVPSFFSLASNDQSYYFLGQIFGNVGSVLTTPDSKLLLGVMFKSLNTTALILGAILVTHTTVVGLIKTATEGEFLGKQWSSVWVPIRMVLGIASLFPTSMGYSILQIAMMWVILQGVGAADTLWNVVVNYISLAGSPYASLSSPTAGTAAQGFKALFQEMTCAQTAKLTASDTYSDSSGNPHYLYYCGDPAHSTEHFCVNQPSLGDSIQSPVAPVCFPNKQSGTITCNIGPSGACGQLTVADQSTVCPPPTISSTDPNANADWMSSQLKCTAYTAQSAVIGQVLTTLDTAAKDIATFDYQYKHFREDYSNPTVSPPAAPQFVQSYCSLMGIAQNACCFINFNVMDVFNIVPYANSPCAKQGSSTFPESSNTNNGIVDYGNANQKGMQNIIWPCGIAPILSGGSTGTCLQTTTSTTDFITSSTNYYSSYISTAVGTELTTLLGENPPQLDEWATNAEATGWLSAGGIYYKMANMNSNNLQSASAPLLVQATNPNTDNGNALRGYRNNFNAAAYMMNTIQAQTADTASQTDQNPTLQQVSSSLNPVASGVVSMFMSGLAGANSSGQATNPLVGISTLGEGLLLAAQSLYVALLVLAVYVLTLSDINAIVLGTGLTSEPGEGAVSFAFYTIFAIVYAILGWMFTFGGMLGIYTPLVPYTIFTFGAIGWFIAVIEAMIAAPFVALGILSPGGQSELLGKADAGLMILFNTFLRPSLMIMGMMAAMLFSPVVVTLINSTFLAVMGSITPNPGIMELMLFMSAYASLVLTALNKSFALIHLVPDRVMSWIGHHHAGVGGSDGSDATGAMKGATDSMGGGANAAAAGSTKGAGSAAAGSAKKQQSEDAAADNAGIMAGTEGASIGGTKAKRDAEKAKKGK